MALDFPTERFARNGEELVQRVVELGRRPILVDRQEAVRDQRRALAGVPDGTQVYFTHSYAAPVTGETVAVTTHGARFSSVVERDRVFGVQFHPEKSGDAGLRVLRNFVRLAGP